jgi:hypothetical protein
VVRASGDGEPAAGGLVHGARPAAEAADRLRLGVRHRRGGQGCADVGVEQRLGVRPGDQARTERLIAEICTALHRIFLTSADAAVEAVAHANLHISTRVSRSIGMPPSTALFGVGPRANLQSLLGDAAQGPVVGRDMAELVETTEAVHLCSEGSSAPGWPATPM